MERIKKILLLMFIIILPYHFQIISIFLSDFGVLKLWKEMVIGILFLITVFQLVTRRKKFTISGFEAFVAAFVAVVFLYVVFSDSMYQALYISRIYLVPILIVPIIKYMDISMDDIRFALKIMMVNVIVLCLWGVFQAHILGDEFLINMGYQTKRVHHALKLKNEFYMLGGGFMQRVTSTFAAPNTYGMFLAVMISVVLYGYKKLGINKIFAYVMILISLITLVLTYSRTSWIACAAAFILYFIINLDKKQKVFAAKLFGCGIALFVVYVIIDILFIHTSVVNAFTTLVYNTFTGRDSSFLGHMQSWMESIENVIKNPMGLGLGNNGPRAKLFEKAPNLTESSYFLMQYEVGIIGAIIYFAGYFKAISDNVKFYKNNRKSEILVIASITIIMLLGYLSLPFVQDFELLAMFYIMASLQYCEALYKS